MDSGMMGGCYCREKPKNNFCEFSWDVQSVMKKLDDAFVNMSFDDDQSSQEGCPCKKGFFCNHDYNDTDTGGFCEGCGSFK